MQIMGYDGNIQIKEYNLCHFNTYIMEYTGIDIGIEPTTCTYIV